MQIFIGVIDYNAEEFLQSTIDQYDGKLIINLFNN